LLPRGRRRYLPGSRDAKPRRAPVIIAVDFDGTIVEQDTRAYDDQITPLVLMPNAKRALLMFKRAGHKLVLWSARSSRDLLYNYELDPLVRAGIRQVNPERWYASLPINWFRYEQMKLFVALELPGIFDCIDDGASGKLHVDLFIDDKVMRYGLGRGALTWENLAVLFGSPVQEPAVIPVG
jgi:hypothetical protein